MSFSSLFQHNCGCGDENSLFRPHLGALAITRQFQDMALLPPDFVRFPISAILNRMFDFDEFEALGLFGSDIRRELVQCRKSGCEFISITHLIEDTDENVSFAARGICLECLKANRDLSKRRACCPRI